MKTVSQNPSSRILSRDLRFPATPPFLTEDCGIYSRWAVLRTPRRLTAALPRSHRREPARTEQRPSRRSRMSPLKQSTNIAARMGRWSASHRKTAIFGWLAFVIASFAIGTGVGMQTIDQNDTNVGEARTADHIIRDAGFKLDEQSEYVLVQSKTKTASRPRLPRGRHGRDRQARGAIRKVDQAPLAARGRQRGPDLDRRPLGADPVQPARAPTTRPPPTSTRSPPPPPRCRRPTPTSTSPRPARLDRQGARRDVQLAARPRGHDLDPDHARDPAARVRLGRGAFVPLAPRADGRLRDVRASSRCRARSSRWTSRSPR